jgi:alcohol dehydrogenase class IV
MAQIARALGADDAALGLFELAGAIGVRRSLKDIGMREQDIDGAADLAVKNPYWNPRQIDREAIRALIARAWAGTAPVNDAKTQVE